MRLNRLVAVVTVGFVVTTGAFGQAVPAAGSQASTLVAQAMAALTHGVPVADATLNANVTWIAGSDYLTGTGVFQAKGTTESRVDLDLGEKARTEIRDASGGVPQGAWVTAARSAISTAQPQTYALHNCWTDAVWFFPALSSLAQGSETAYIFSYAGEEQHDGVSTQHLRSYQLSALDAKNTLGVQRLSTMDFYLDPSSMLPLAVAFKIHPDKDMNTDIPVEVRFANYQTVSGVEIPFHIQQLLNGTLAVDVVVNSAAVNSGLQDSVFTIQ